MRLFLDECLSPKTALDLMASGEHFAVHPRNLGGLGAPDHQVVARCIDDDLVLVTANARDFRSLMAHTELHPGLITLPSVEKHTAEALLGRALSWLRTRGDPADLMVNHVLELEMDGTVSYYESPKS